ncbi:CRP/FNR family transcriptional regulator, anaerobic regulatory protein [Thiothrix caldifontis]|uniref:CRP/FNR family transcriptional regulator, anaerobic regulatory protein n=1 Tax=Thiothrix caldifontis TaxID=525918 RepID=A0A1H4GC58_9GAMM|nr:Crp/Fnr family transcriptional regulator [Thiothrix caldifontis]SEB07213.1 CRP/FNR family transcriptional regulator, anaerobic regulatory protein [Thiothrix caldifontis]
MRVPQLQAKGHCSTCSIRPITIFSTLNAAEVEQIQAFQPAIIRYEPGEIIYHQGMEAHYAFTLRQGFVKIVNSLADGRSHIVQLLRDGDFFGFGGLSGVEYKHSATALNTVEVCRLPLADLLKLKHTHPKVETEMTKRWLERLHRAESMLVELGAKKAAERLASFLLRWCAGNAPNTWVALPLNRAEIGELLGVTIETVSRFFADWKRQGFIGESRGNIQMLDAAGLRQVVGIDE